MKFLKGLSILLLSGCASQPRMVTYDCALLTRHAVRFKLQIDARSQELAEQEANKVRLNLVKEKAISENSAAMCYKAEDDGAASLRHFETI